MSKVNIPPLLTMIYATPERHTLQFVNTQVIGSPVCVDVGSV